MRRAALLFNPRAGQGRGARTLAAVENEIRSAFELDALPTRSPSHFRALARTAVEDRLDVLFVLGGDGSLRLAASELLGTETALGPLPGGTTNVVARALGLPRDPATAARRLLAAEPRRLDVGRAGDEVFLMQISGGLDAKVLAAVDERWKRRLGKAAIAWTALREWARYRFPPFALEVDGERLTATAFVAANLAEYAGAFRIVPAARADDRQLDLLLFRGATRAAALGFALDLARGRQAARADVTIRPFERLRLTAPDPLPLQADGDAFTAAAPFDLGLAARRLQVLAPTP